MSIDQQAVIEDLIERIIEFTKSPQSENFYRKSIRLLGPGYVEGEVAEVRYRYNSHQIDDPAAYLTTLLRKQFPTDLATAEETGGVLPKESYFSPTAKDLIAELDPGPATAKDCDGQPSYSMSKPYSGKAIPWTTFVSSDFFTLSTNKKKSDRVVAKFHTMDGQVVQIPMIRGMNFPGSTERGILTVEHGRILGALEMLWAEQNTFFENSEKKISICYCDVHIRNIARMLGWKTFGGHNAAYLKNKIIDLSIMPFYLDIIDAADTYNKMRGYGFTFLGSVTTKEKDRLGHDTTFRIIFSPTMSSQLLKRRVVSRNPDILTHRSELAFLLRLYLESIVVSRNGKPYSIELPSLIEKLNLPDAGWHRDKTNRKQQFQKAIKELDGKMTADGRVISASIAFNDKLSNEYCVLAYLVGKAQFK